MDLIKQTEEFGTLLHEIKNQEDDLVSTAAHFLETKKKIEQTRAEAYNFLEEHLNHTEGLRLLRIAIKADQKWLELALCGVERTHENAAILKRGFENFKTNSEIAANLSTLNRITIILEEYQSVLSIHVQRLVTEIAYVNNPDRKTFDELFSMQSKELRRVELAFQRTADLDALYSFLEKTSLSVREATHWDYAQRAGLGASSVLILSAVAFMSKEYQGAIIVTLGAIGAFLLSLRDAFREGVKSRIETNAVAFNEKGLDAMTKLESESIR